MGFHSSMYGETPKKEKTPSKSPPRLTKNIDSGQLPEYFDVQGVDTLLSADLLGVSGKLKTRPRGVAIAPMKTVQDKYPQFDLLGD